MNLDLPLKTFAKVGEAQLETGDTLQVDSYVIAEKMAAVAEMLTWRTHDGMPGLDDLRDGLDPRPSSDERQREAFFKLISKLAEERRHAKDPGEYDQYIRNYDPTGRFTHQAEKRGRWNLYLFPTGYVEVSGGSLKAGDPGARYFVRIQDALGSAAELNTKAERLRILQGLTVYLMRELPTRRSDSGIAQAREAVASVCQLGACVLDGDRPVGRFVVDSLLIFLAGRQESHSEEELDQINYKKQICILKRLHQICPGLADLGSADELVKKAGKLECDDTDSILGVH